MEVPENLDALKSAPEKNAPKKGPADEALAAAARKGRFPLKLGRVARRLGISKDVERALRVEFLTADLHYAEFGNGICYSEAGVAWLAEKIAGGNLPILQKKCPPHSVALRGEAGDDDGTSDSALPLRPVLGLLAERSGMGEPVRLTVWRTRFVNRRVIECYVLGTRTLVTVNVRSSENFLPGMIIWARTEGRETNWVFLGDGTKEPVEGAHCPRFRGRF